MALRRVSEGCNGAGMTDREAAETVVTVPAIWLRGLRHRPDIATSAQGRASSSRSRFTAVLIRERWLNACGKLPVCWPVGAISSE